MERRSRLFTSSGIASFALRSQPRHCRGTSSARQNWFQLEAMAAEVLSFNDLRVPLRCPTGAREKNGYSGFQVEFSNRNSAGVTTDSYSHRAHRTVSDGIESFSRLLKS